MTIRITELSELDSDLVRQEEEQLVEMLQEDNSTINARQGVLRDYLAYYGGVLSAKNQTEQTRLRESMSLAAVQADPSLADEDVVDNIASNFRVTRRAGETAGGTVVVVVNELAALTIGAGTLFEALGQQLVTESAFTARVSSELVVSSTDRILTPVGDGTYSFLVEAVAVLEGSAGNISKDTLLTIEPEPLSFVKAMAAEDFVGGTDIESNTDLLDRFVEGAAAKAFSGRENMIAAAKNVDAFTPIVADSIIGLGDTEMLRDQHSIFPGSLGGRVDWYVRTQPIYRRYGATKSATLIEIGTDGYGVWQMSFTRDEFPGLYDVLIKPATGDFAGYFEILEDIRSADVTALDDGDGFLPDIATAVEAVYSRFQAVVVKFQDTVTVADSLTLGATADYDVTIRAMPLIAELQDYALGRRVRNVMGDALIKAPVPCFLEVGFTIELRPGQTTPDTDAIAEDIANLVNYYGFTGRLPASALFDVVHNSLPVGASLTNMDMFGKIRKPSGDYRYARSSDVLLVVDEADEMSTSRTVAFFLDPGDVTIAVVTADVPEV